MRNYDIYQRKEKLKRCFSWTIMEECLPKDIVIEYKEAFRILDRKKVGKISVRDVSTMVCSIGIRLSEAGLLEFVGRVVDLNNRELTEHCVTFPQFLATMTSIITNCVPEEEAERIFKEFDKDGDGFISANELRDLLSRLGDDVTDKEIQEMIDEADTDGDGLVSLQEFINVMNSASANESIDNAIEHYPIPRILKDTEEDFSFEPSCSSACCNETEDDEDPIHSSAESSELDDFVKEDLNFSKNKENDSTLLRKNKNNGQKRRKSIVDWIKGSPPKEIEQFKFSSTESSSDYLSSSICSLASAEEPSASAIPPHLRNRRRSSITKTLKSGRDALVATAKRFRKLSR